MDVQSAAVAAVVSQFGHPRGAAGRVVGWVEGASPVQPPAQQRGGFLARCAAHRSGSRDRFRSRTRDRRAEPTTRLLRARLRDRPVRGDAQPGDQAQRRCQLGRTGHADPGVGRSAPARPRWPLQCHHRRQLPRVLAGTDRATRRATPTTRARRTHRRCLPAPLPGVTASSSLNAARRIEDLLRGAGFTQMVTETLDLDPPVSASAGRRTLARSRPISRSSTGTPYPTRWPPREVPRLAVPLTDAPGGRGGACAGCQEAGRYRLDEPRQHRSDHG